MIEDLTPYQLGKYYERLLRSGAAGLEGLHDFQRPHLEAFIYAKQSVALEQAIRDYDNNPQYRYQEGLSESEKLQHWIDKHPGYFDATRALMTMQGVSPIPSTAEYTVEFTDLTKPFEAPLEENKYRSLVDYFLPEHRKEAAPKILKYLKQNYSGCKGKPLAVFWMALQASGIVKPRFPHGSKTEIFNGLQELLGNIGVEDGFTKQLKDTVDHKDERIQEALDEIKVLLH